MQITELRAYRQLQPLRDGTYGTSGGSAEAFDSLIVALHSDTGLVGWGEMAPLGAFYSPAFAAGARAGLPELASFVVGCELVHPQQLMRRLDRHMQGHPYIKSAIDMAAWDITAQAAGKPLCEMLGGRYGDTVDLYRPVPPTALAAETAARYVAEGYRRLQVKVGGDPLDDAARVRAIRDAVDPSVVLFTDANGAWTTAQARAFLQATPDLAITVEQPCATLRECAAIRPHCPHPIVLDESIDSLAALIHAATHGIADGITLKLSRLGGLTPTLLLRNVAVEHNIPTTIEDTGGASIDTAAMIHASLSTPEPFRIHTCDFQNWVSADHATGIPELQQGRIAPPAGDGLGVRVDVEALGEPFFRSA
jgi:L-alanine-DL-glutamate epimerase-like enolase superfamily enzyme